MITPKTLNMSANTGYVMRLDDPAGKGNGYSSVKIRATAVCFVQLIPYAAVPIAVTAPTVTPAPAADATADWYKIAANEVVQFGVESPKGASDIVYVYSDSIQQIRIWATAQGDFVVNAH